MDGFFTPTTREPPKVSELVVRLLVATVLVLAALKFFERSIEKSLISVDLIAKEVQLLSPALAVESSMIVYGRGEDAYRARVYVSRMIQIGDHVLLPSGWHGIVPRTVLEVTIPLGVIMRYWAMTLIVVLAWPAGWRELVLRCLFSLPLLLLQSLVAVPSLTLSALWDQVQWEMDIHRITGWKLWSGALFDGGGLLIATVLATLVIAAAKRIANPKANSNADHSAR